MSPPGWSRPMPRIVIVITLLLFMEGCSLHEIRSPEPPPSLPIRYPLQDRNNVWSSSRWWEGFNDSRLNRLMEKSFSGNLDIQQAVSRLRQARILYHQAGTSQLPSLSLDGSAGRKKTLTTAGSLTDNSFSVSLSAAYELDLWKKIASSTAETKACPIPPNIA